MPLACVRVTRFDDTRACLPACVFLRDICSRQLHDGGCALPVHGWGECTMAGRVKEMLKGV